MFLEGLSQGMAFERRPECSKGGSLTAVWGRLFLAEGRAGAKGRACEGGA